MRQVRKAAAFWLPTVVVLMLTLVLVLFWPHKRRHAAQVLSLPEATASYVLLDGSYQALPGSPLGNPWFGPRSSTLPEREEIVVRRLPAPEYAGARPVTPWAPLPYRAPSNTLPNLADRPVADLLTGSLLQTTNRVALTLSPELQRSSFRFELPLNATTGLAAVARFSVELDAQGNVIHLLAEPGNSTALMRPLETAISRGHGTGAARGEVTVSWGR